MLKFVFIFILTTQVAFSFDYKTYLTPYRTKIEKYLGKELSDKILGKVDEIQMPVIPKIVRDAKSTNVYKKNIIDPKEASISASDKEKYDYVFMRELYQVVRNEEDASQKFTKWLGVLSQGGTREGIYRALVLNQDYAALENYSIVTNDSVIEFTEMFLKKYLNSNLKRTTLENLNFYTLKREITERSLETFDAFKNEKDLQVWYAIFSSEVALKYGHLFKNKLRKNINKKIHIEWASKVPAQHVKSELIIKLHKVFNFLMG